MPEFEFNYYETVKYRVKFVARDRDEADALIFEALHPQDLPEAEISELKSSLDVDERSVVELEVFDEEV